MSFGSDQLLQAHGRTFYWLAKETGISYTTLWRLKNGKVALVQFRDAGKMFQALGWQL